MDNQQIADCPVHDQRPLTPQQLQQEAQIILWLQHQGLTPAQLISLWRYFGNYCNALQADRQTIATLLNNRALKPFGEHREAWRQYQPPAVLPDVELLPINSPHYPKLLQQLHCPPPLLYVRGDTGLLSMPQLAIVGSRKHSLAAGDTSRAFARELCRCGFAITSGLALGIDSMAHQGALDSGKTVAVLASGVERIYPRRHQQLAQRILDSGGALVSEMPANTQPLPACFPRRNRIISGLCLGVLVVEAASKSGSLITARYAMEQGREVFAIPGSIHNPMARGCHQLIRDGAALVETVDDIAEQLSAMVELKRGELHQSPCQKSQPLHRLPPDERRVLQALDYDPVDFDVLIDRTDLRVTELTTLLLSLELQGLIEQNAGKYQRTG